MKQSITATVVFMSLLLFAPLSFASAEEKPGLLQACMPEFSADNTLAIPEQCSYTISAYMDAYMQKASAMLTKPAPASTASSNHAQSAHYANHNASMDQQALCAVSETGRTKLAMAISNKLAAAGQSNSEIEAIVNDSIAEQYSC